MIDAARPLLFDDQGLAVLHARVPAIEAAGFFRGSDWDHPQTLVPSLAVRTIRHGDPVVDSWWKALSQIRLLAVARGDYAHPSISAEHAHHFLAQVLAMNLDLVVSDLQESDRLRPDAARVTRFRIFITTCFGTWATRIFWSIWWPRSGGSWRSARSRWMASNRW
ncbi:MAG: hypothetical protein U5R48_13900 [Gammaproteobacteria bacterium]|nr:hypothetical protein [Gammaproteobacteria bacterium]